VKRDNGSHNLPETAKRNLNQESKTQPNRTE
jgi:hypothetical protein